MQAGVLIARFLPMEKRIPIFGAVVGVVIGVAVNIVSLAGIVFNCMDCPVSYGVPFVIVTMGGFGGPQRIFWGALIVDLLSFIVVGILLVAALKAVSRRRRRLRPE
jgi:hypothetical protein